MKSNNASPRRTAVLISATLAVAAVSLTGCGAPAASPSAAPSAAQTGLVAVAPITFAYVSSNTAQQYTVPAGVTSLAITAIGAGGGQVRQAMSGPASTGAKITGNLAVTPGQVLQISVGQEGATASDSNTDPKGGWGGLGANGGNGNAAADTLRTGGAGGGATVIQLANGDGSNAQTVLVAGGGGGAGGRSGDLTPKNLGGSAGCSNGAPSWTGANGDNGTSGPQGGNGGKAAGESGMAGGRSKGGSGLGGNGGGGGGGVNGGAPGTSAKGTSAAGGGGAGSSSVNGMSQTAIFCNTSGGNGSVLVAPSS